LFSYLALSTDTVPAKGDGGITSRVNETLCTLRIFDSIFSNGTKSWQRKCLFTYFQHISSRLDDLVEWNGSNVANTAPLFSQYLIVKNEISKLVKPIQKAEDDDKNHSFLTSSFAMLLKTAFRYLHFDFDSFTLISICVHV